MCFFAFAPGLAKYVLHTFKFGYYLTEMSVDAFHLRQLFCYTVDTVFVGAPIMWWHFVYYIILYK